MGKKLAALRSARRAAVLSGCAQGAAVMPTPGVTLAPPTPAGMEELPPEPARAPTDERLDRTASLRPFPNKAEADAAVVDHPQPRQADRRPRHRQQPVQLPRPDHR